MHLAAALGRPLVALYGPSDPVIAPPFSQPSRLVRLGLLCSPCDRRECPLGTTACLVDMPVEQVAEALRAVTA
jgi:heptosyltransferase-2